MMTTADEFYKNIENNFISWAQSIEDIRAAFIVGSRARHDHPADKWSDLDIVVFTSNQNYYLTNNEWLKNIGNIWTAFVYKTAGGDPECLALFDGGWQVDFVIHSTDHLKKIVDSKTIPENFYRGVKVIIDKDRVSQNILPECAGIPNNNTMSEGLFIQLSNMFWFAALYTAKQILRNELWVAKTRDNNLKDILLQVIEWHEKAVNGNDYDTWHAGRFMSEWASKETQTELRNSFGHFDRKDSWKALNATINLYKRLACEIAQRMNFSYPYELEKNITDWINDKSNLINT